MDERDHVSIERPCYWLEIGCPVYVKSDPNLWPPTHPCKPRYQRAEKIPANDEPVGHPALLSQRHCRGTSMPHTPGEDVRYVGLSDMRHDLSWVRNTATDG
jgi:hypothetical protein